MRGRDIQARLTREDGEDRGTQAPNNGLRFWQVLAIAALIAATAGWTTVAVIALRPSSTPAAVAVAPPSDEPLPSGNASVEPPIESHDVADLEALLPADVNGTTLTRESWTGDTVLGDDPWSTSMTAFLTTSGKTAADLQTSQAYDAASLLDLSAGAFRVSGIAGTALRDAIIAAYKGDYPNLKLTKTTIGGLAVTSGDFGDGSGSSYWYVRGDVVFDIETGDPSIAKAALEALPSPDASATPSSTTPASPGPSVTAPPTS